MNKGKNLQELRSKIKTLKVEKENYKIQLQQLKNREKIIIKQAKMKEQKKRAHRLIVRGAILESFIDGASKKSNEEIKGILQNLFHKS